MLESGRQPTDYPTNQDPLLLQLVGTVKHHRQSVDTMRHHQVHHPQMMIDLSRRAEYRR